jgi:hypothetical protein
MDQRVKKSVHEWLGKRIVDQSWVDRAETEEKQYVWQEGQWLEVEVVEVVVEVLPRVVVEVVVEERRGEERRGGQTKTVSISKNSKHL